MSDLPNSVDFMTMVNAIAWEMAKESTRLMKNVQRDEMLKALLDDFILASYRILNEEEQEQTKG